jgi:hypothetical protein
MGEKIEVALATGEGEKREGGRLERMGERDTGASEEDDSRRGALMDGDDGGGSERLSWRSGKSSLLCSPAFRTGRNDRLADVCSWHLFS